MINPEVIQRGIVNERTMGLIRALNLPEDTLSFDTLSELGRSLDAMQMLSWTEGRAQGVEELRRAVVKP